MKLIKGLMGGSRRRSSSMLTVRRAAVDPTAVPGC